MDDYQEGEYFDHNDSVVILIGDQCYGVDTNKTSRQIGNSVAKLIEEVRLKRGAGADQ
jgi:hypothetical protein